MEYWSVGLLHLPGIGDRRQHILWTSAASINCSALLARKLILDYSPPRLTCLQLGR
jgi:hypothetical protein